MLTTNHTGTEVQAELKVALKQWKEENPAPKLEVEAAPELPEPTIIKTEKQLIIVEVLSGELIQLHVLDGNSVRKVDLDHKQLGKLIRALIDSCKPMKIYRIWQNLYDEDVNRFDAALAAWNRNYMNFQDAVKRRLGFIKETSD